MKPLPLGDHPVIIATGGQRPRIEGHRGRTQCNGFLGAAGLFGRDGLIELCFKFRDIQGKSNRRSPLHHLMIGVNSLGQHGRHLPEMGQGFAQVGQCLGFTRIRPEQESQMPTGLGRVTMQQQIGEQCLLARLWDSYERSVTSAKPKIT